MEHVDGEWIPWTLDFPELPGLPGDANPPSLWTVIIGVLRWLFSKHDTLVKSLGQKVTNSSGLKKPHWWERLTEHPFDALEDLAATESGKLLHLARSFAEGLHDDPKTHDPEHHSRIAEMVESVWHDVQKLYDAGDNWPIEIRRLFILFDLVKANLIGILRDGLLIHPEKVLPKVNEFDYRQWMLKHGAYEITVDSAPIRALYDLIFAYPGGDIEKPGDVEAGSMLMALMQLWRYRGAVTWKMRAGTGDVAIAPMYEVLKKRGVRFEFFSRVVDLEPSPDGNYINRVHISKQVNLTEGTYDPLFECAGIPCWPSKPDYNQIVEGEKLKRENINLESRWTPWVDTGGEETLTVGEDFDIAILGISIDALPDICSKLIAEKSPWQQMIKNIKTVQTQSVQLWLDTDLKGTGWKGIPGSVLGAYDVSPLDTWSDISEVLSSECWKDPKPQNESIICGPMKGPPTAPPSSDKSFPEENAALVLEHTVEYLENFSAALWPNLNQGGKFDWGILHDTSGAIGQDRLNSQYLHANIDPTERYVQSVAGSSVHRLRTDQSGFLNLYLTGDWIDNPQNLGSFEATVMSGKLASRAISGFPKHILRVSDDNPLMKMRPPFQLPSAGNPRFVDHSGMQSFPGPIEFKNMDMWGFFLKGDYDRLAAVCRKFFNETSGGELNYVPLTSHVLVTIVDIPDGRFVDEPEMGVAREKELAFWIYAGKLKSPGSNVIERLGCFNPYLFLDNPIARVTGREVFGYQKQAGWLDLPAADDPNGQFSIDAYGVTARGSDVMWGRHPLMSLTPSGEINGNPAVWQNFEEAAKGLAKLMHGDGPWLWPGLELIEQLVEDALKGELPQLFLKQFRDIADGRNACYQAITEAPAKITSLNGVQLENTYDVAINYFENMQICNDLGLSPNCKTEIGFKLNIDMTVEPGKEVWRA